MPAGTPKGGQFASAKGGGGGGGGGWNKPKSSGSKGATSSRGDYLSDDEAKDKERNGSNLKKMKYSKLAGGQTSDGLKYEIHGPNADSPHQGKYLVVKSRDLGEIGRATVSRSGKGDYVTSVRVTPERRGIGTKLYKTIEKDLGRKLKPSESQSPEAASFWAKRNK